MRSLSQSHSFKSICAGGYLGLRPLVSSETVGVHIVGCEPDDGELPPEKVVLREIAQLNELAFARSPVAPKMTMTQGDGVDSNFGGLSS
jgi:hypothetical protein